MQLDPLLVLSGAFVGTIVGLTGVGGGSLMTPILVLVFGIHPVTAVGTDLLYASVTKATGSLVHGLNRNVAWRVVGLLAAGSVPAAAMTLAVISGLGIQGAASARLVSIALGCALMLTATLLLFRKSLQAWRPAVEADPDPRREAILTVATGAVLGALVAMTSVGAGAVGVTALLLLFPRLPVVRIVGTDIVHAVPLTAVAGFGHWWIGNVDFVMLGTLLIGSIPGILVGSYLAPHVPEWALRKTLAVVLVMVGAKLIFS